MHSTNNIEPASMCCSLLKSNQERERNSKYNLMLMTRKNKEEQTRDTRTHTLGNRIETDTGGQSAIPVPALLV